MKKLIFFSCLLILVFVRSSFAEGHVRPYFSTGLCFVEYEFTGGSFNPTAISFIAGDEFSQNIAAEWRFYTGLEDDSADNVGVDYFLGAYVRGMIAVGRVKPYLIAGLSAGELTSKAPNDLRKHDSGFSYGLGADFIFSEKVVMNLEYLQLTKKTDFEFSTFSLGAKFFF